jgi:hypothetical protein
MNRRQATLTFLAGILAGTLVPRSSRAATTSDAKTLLLDLLAVIPDGDKSADFFAEDGVLELPFLHAVGIPTRYQGRAAIKQFYNFVGGKLYSDFGFKPQDIKVLIETPDQIFAEYMTHTKAVGTKGRLSYCASRSTPSLRHRLSTRTARRTSRRRVPKFSPFHPAISVERRGSDERPSRSGRCGLWAA